MPIARLRVAVVASALLSACAGAPAGSSAAHVLSLPKTGFVPVDGGKVAYWIEGTGHGTPLLVLHGGPGIPHDYLANLAELGDQRPVVFYDQLGCGKSDRPATTSAGPSTTSSPNSRRCAGSSGSTR